MNLLLKGFQEFWRENSEIWTERFEYKEAAPHLILQAFLQRVINGGAHILREFASGITNNLRNWELEEFTHTRIPHLILRIRRFVTDI